MRELRLPDLRLDYTRARLRHQDMKSNPLAHFTFWFIQAQELFEKNQSPFEANAMCLASSDANGFVSSRFVLLKHLDAKGLTFYTNLNSDKSKNLLENPKASVTFFWPSLERQVHFQVFAKLVDRSIVNRYYQSRPIASRVSACISPQSQIIPNSDFLIKKHQNLTKNPQKIPQNAPDYWGAWILRPYRCEFWQGGKNRLHDRFAYTLKKVNPKNIPNLDNNKEWTINRLAP